jgi:hypothetical protein
MENVLKVARVVGKKKMPEKLPKDRTAYTR